ncbi:hypothetical protein L3X38_022458 [Prunus dulcis]|uniref:K+ potassium transporter integral membrane domain-containing protein n=1 Tax=Prunus dulcis TaxID=3755 RepID=A0AAD4VXN8_PRUDU|nr:hypothetical protein L3X38_022458 [Prunus dulcis]
MPRIDSERLPLSLKRWLTLLQNNGFKFSGLSRLFILHNTHIRLNAFFPSVLYLLLLSAVGGINVGHSKISNEVVVLVAVVILVLLFSMQHHGTDKRGGKGWWTSLGGIMLRITGTEALFADLSHFPVSSVQICGSKFPPKEYPPKIPSSSLPLFLPAKQIGVKDHTRGVLAKGPPMPKLGSHKIAFTLVVFPCLLLAYCGQAAYLVKNSNNMIGAFYHSIPDNIYWPVFMVATAAAVVARDSIVPDDFPLHANNITSSIPASNQVGTDDEVEFLNNCRDAGMAHILGNTVIEARRESKFWKKIAIDYLYAFLRKMCRENSVMFNVPHESLLNVGQVF